jgi:hypothetical protein
MECHEGTQDKPALSPSLLKRSYSFDELWSRVRDGGDVMPPMSHLTEDDVLEIQDHLDRLRP